MKHLIHLWLLLFALQPVSAQVGISQYSMSEIAWLKAHRFEVDVYDWKDPYINAKLQRAIQKKDLVYKYPVSLRQATSRWYKQNGLMKYEGPEKYRRFWKANWLKRRNIYVEYYDGSDPEANDLLKAALRSRLKTNLGKTFSVGMITVGAGAIVVGMLGKIVAPVLIVLISAPFGLSTDESIRETQKSLNWVIFGGAVTSLSGTLVFNLIHKKGAKKQAGFLSRFHNIWFNKVSFQLKR